MTGGAERVAAAKARERASRRAGPGRDGAPLELIETLAEDANVRVRRVWAVDAIERLFQRWFAEAVDARALRAAHDRYRLVRAIEADWERALALQSPARFHRLRPDAEEFALAPVAIGASAHQPAGEDARARLGRAAAAAGPRGWGALCDLIVLRAPLRVIARRRRIRDTHVRAVIEAALDAVAAEKIYERRKWRVPIRRPASP
jgi:hypothetical protein